VRSVERRTTATGPRAVVLRSTDLTIDDDGALAGDLEESLFLGAHWRHYVRIGDTLVIVDGPAPLAPGRVRVSVPSDRVRVYPSEGGLSC